MSSEKAGDSQRYTDRAVLISKPAKVPMPPVTPPKQPPASVMKPAVTPKTK